jgi:hypothetical protein
MELSNTLLYVTRNYEVDVFHNSSSEGYCILQLDAMDLLHGAESFLRS